MAAPMLQPYVPEADEIRLKEAVLLLARSGHRITIRTLQRRCKLRRVTVVIRGGFSYASWSDLLLVHRDWVDAREARTP